jgi:hypothetical protein
MDKTAHIQEVKVVFDAPDIPPRTHRITGYDDNGEPISESNSVQIRPEALSENRHVISWERPPHREAYRQQGTKRKSSC